MIQNEEVWELWTIAGTQLNLSFRGIAGINFPAFYEVAGALQTPITRNLTIKLKALEQALLEKHRAETEDKKDGGQQTQSSNRR